MDTNAIVPGGEPEGCLIEVPARFHSRFVVSHGRVVMSSVLLIVLAIIAIIAIIAIAIVWMVAMYEKQAAILRA